MNEERNHNWHAMELEALLQQLKIDPEPGLQAAEVEDRLAKHGPNELEEEAATSQWVLFFHQFKSPLIYVLLAAAVVAGALGEYKDAAVITGVLLINALIGYIQEGRAERSMAALKKLSSPKSHVRRGGKSVTIPSRDLVPGDVLLLAAGDKIAADAWVIEAAGLVALEGALTGESTGVSKRAGAVAEDAPLGDRKNMVFAGTAIAAGRGEAVVVETAMRTELGKIATMVQGAGVTLTPLQVRLKGFSKLIIVVVLTVMALVFLLGWLRGLELREIFLVALSQAVSAIPEGLPVAVTVALAVGMQRMARKRSVIRKLAAVETLGSATVICTDKTGTLTKNEMSVTRVVLPDADFEVGGIGYDPAGDYQTPGGDKVSVSSGDPLGGLLECAALCNDSSLNEPSGDAGWEIQGDPTEGALVVAAIKAGIDVEALRREQKRQWEIPFSSEIRLMATGHRTKDKPDALRVCAKGAPEAILQLCHAARGKEGEQALDDSLLEAMRKSQRDMSDHGLRVLAIAQAEMNANDLGEDSACLKGRLVFLGLVGQIDPPRPEVREAVAMCRDAGVRTIMVTGDHMLTGHAIARDLGITSESSTAMEGADLVNMNDEDFDRALEDVAVFGRVAPEHKLRIVERFQARGDVVAMTGDGVNDAPALAKADIGVAMGITGTEVAKEASAMVITDDNFATIVSAIRQGRIIFNNIRKAVYYLFSTSAGEILTLFTALIAGLPLPLRAVQILWINLVTDGALTVNLVMEKAEGDEMKRQPLRRNAAMVPRTMLRRMMILVPVMGFGTVAMFAWALQSGRATEHAQTMTFTLLCAFQWFNGLNARSYSRSVFQLGLFSNPFVLAGLTVAIGLQVLVVHLPLLQSLFHTVPLAPAEWGLILLVASSILWVDEIRKLLIRRKSRNEDA
jgi:magnesium-transporting ATPase (P-type)